MKTLKHKFVEHVPENLEEGIVYVSIEFGTVIHKCCCGCGNEVVTPLSPNDWKLTFDGETISLSPSIGNWSFECQSHYWIRNSSIEWAPKWSGFDIDKGRQLDREKRKKKTKKKKRKILFGKFLFWEF